MQWPIQNNIAGHIYQPGPQKKIQGIQTLRKHDPLLLHPSFRTLKEKTRWFAWQLKENSRKRFSDVLPHNYGKKFIKTITH